MTVELVRANGIDLCVETFGDPADPAVLLIGGLATSMDWWDDEFCERLAAGRRFVIRYDHRDTGRSTGYPPGAPAYTGSDLTSDALGLLDALSLARAHIVGISAGGGIAQELVAQAPDRVASLTLISTSPIGLGNQERSELPPMSEEFEAIFAEPTPDPDWSDRAAVIDYLVEDERAYEGPDLFDEGRARALAGRIFDRTTNIESSIKNHWILEEGEPIDVRLGEVTAPTLVLHGTEDPLFPLPHGEALARAIPGARLIPLEGVGHQVPPPPVWDVVIPAVLEHTSP